MHKGVVLNGSHMKPDAGLGVRVMCGEPWERIRTPEVLAAYLLGGLPAVRAMSVV